jgi:hypothetical protein
MIVPSHPSQQQAYISLNDATQNIYRGLQVCLVLPRMAQAMYGGVNPATQQLPLHHMSCCVSCRRLLLHLSTML